MTAVSNKKIVENALAARTVDQAVEVQGLIEAAIGARCERPLGNTWNNQGILTGSGSSYDHKALEVVTNMQDAVVELLAVQKYGTRGRRALRQSSRGGIDAARGKTKKDQADLAYVTIDRAAHGEDKKRITLVMGTTVAVSHLVRSRRESSGSASNTRTATTGCRGPSASAV